MSEAILRRPEIHRNVDGLLLVRPDGSVRYLTLLESVKYRLLRIRPGDAQTLEPIPMVLHCPACGTQHVDAPEPEAGWTNPPHKSHFCHCCGCVWRPADVPTNGVVSITTRGEADTWPAV